MKSVRESAFHAPHLSFVVDCNINLCDQQLFKRGKEGTHFRFTNNLYTILTCHVPLFYTALILYLELKLYYLKK